jgi:hypothetical protein
MTKGSLIRWRLLFLFIFSILVISCSSHHEEKHPREGYWMRQYAAEKYFIEIHSFQQTTENGYILAGQTYRNASVLKLDRLGNISWQKSYGDVYFTSLEQTVDGGYIASGNTDLPLKIWVAKLDASGGVTWRKIFGDDEMGAEGWVVHQTADGGYIVAGRTIHDDPFLGLQSDMLVMKLDHEGTINWQKSYGNMDDVFYYVTAANQTADGGYLLTGCSTHNHYNDVSWVMKLDSTGNISWQKSYLDVYFTSLQQISDAGTVLAGTAIRNDPILGIRYDMLVMKFDSDGSIVSQKSYTNSDQYLVGSDVKQTADGGYVVLGSYSFEVRYDAQWTPLLMKLDNTFNIS